MQHFFTSNWNARDPLGGAPNRQHPGGVS
jgi:hypothetical protein